MMWFKFFIIGVLLCVVISLMMALRGLFRQGSDVTMVRRLTLRVVLSLGAFILLIVGMRQGWIVPHGLRG